MANNYSYGQPVFTHGMTEKIIGGILFTVFIVVPVTVQFFLGVILPHMVRDVSRESQLPGIVTIQNGEL